MLGGLLSGQANLLPPSVRSSARVFEGRHPYAVPTLTPTRRPTPIPRTSLVKPTWWPSRSLGRWSLCVTDPVPTRPGESLFLSCWKTRTVAPLANLAVPARAIPLRAPQHTATHTWPAALPERARGWAALGLKRTFERGSPYVTSTYALLSRGTTSHRRFPQQGPAPRHRAGSPLPRSCRRTLGPPPLTLGSGGVSQVSWLPKPTSRSVFQLMDRATDSTRQNPRTSIYIPDLDLTFSVPSDLAPGGINVGQAEQMAPSRAPVIVDPPWNGKHGHNQQGDPFPYAAAQALTRGEFPEGYAVHHLGRVLPPDEQPQPATLRAPSVEPSPPTAGLGTPRASTDPTAPDLQALGDYMSARLSGRCAQDALDLSSSSEGRAPGDARQSLSRAAAWYQDHHASPQDPAAAAALHELLDPIARLQALGSRRVAVSPPMPPAGLVPGPPTATGRSRSHSPTPRSAAATFLGPQMIEYAGTPGTGICV